MDKEFDKNMENVIDAMYDMVESYRKYMLRKSIITISSIIVSIFVCTKICSTMKM